MSIDGLKRFIQGLAKKLIIANNVGFLVDRVFSQELSNIDYRVAIIGAVCYTLQIYFDFSGYSDMAIGIAKMFGFSFYENFNHPYTAISIQDFWRRWHISLSSWFKEYLYIPLGGNRKGKIRTIINKWIVFLVTGVWHGANMTFIIWGMIHGFFIIFEEFVNLQKYKIIRRIYTMLIVIVAFIFFRADTVTDAIDMIRNIATLNVNSSADIFLAKYVNFMSFFFIILAVILSTRSNTIFIKDKFISMIFYSMLYFYCVVNIASSNFNPFIYFQF